MGTNSPILNIPLVAPNQNQKETTINTATAILEAAANAVQSISLVGGAVTLTSDQFGAAFLTQFSGQTAAVSVTVPATPRWFAFQNQGPYPIQVGCLGANPTTSPLQTVPAGAVVLLMSNGTTIVSVSQGVNTLEDLSDVAGGDSPSQGQILAWEGTQWTPVDNPADIQFAAASLGAGAVLYTAIFARPALYLSDFNGSQVKATAAATASTVLTVWKNGVAVGTLTFAPGATTPTFSTNTTGQGSTTVIFQAGDIVKITAPATADATLAGVVGAIKGAYQ